MLSIRCAPSDAHLPSSRPHHAGRPSTASQYGRACIFSSELRMPTDVPSALTVIRRTQQWRRDCARSRPFRRVSVSSTAASSSSAALVRRKPPSFSTSSTAKRLAGRSASASRSVHQRGSPASLTFVFGAVGGSGVSARFCPISACICSNPLAMDFFNAISLRGRGHTLT
jgi:hypothetical protein